VKSLLDELRRGEAVQRYSTICQHFESVMCLVGIGVGVGI